MSSVPAADLEHILAHTGDIWRALAGARIFITGGTGFFGIWLLETIAAANDALKVGVGATVLSRNPRPFLARMPYLARRREFEWLTGHPANFPFPTVPHDYILHLATATSAHLDRTDPVEMLHTKLLSVRHVLDYARHSGVRRVLVTSSGAVYGPQPAELSHIPETYDGAPDPLDPASAYGTGKRLVEQMCVLNPEVDCVIARCFSFLGPHLPLDARFAAGNFLRDAQLGQAISISGDGRAVRSYLHPADLVIWLLTILFRGKSGLAYNVGSSTPVTLLELAECIARHTPGRLTVRILGKSGACVPTRYVPATRRAERDLGLFQTIPLERAIAGTLAWLDTGQTV